MISPNFRRRSRTTEVPIELFFEKMWSALSWAIQKNPSGGGAEDPKANHVVSEEWIQIESSGGDVDPSSTYILPNRTPSSGSIESKVPQERSEN